MSVQYTKEWYQKRLGKWNGSEIHKLMKKGRKKDEMFGEGAMTYIMKVASERALSKKTLTDDYYWEQFQKLTTGSSFATEWGHDMEPVAIDHYMKYVLALDDVELYSLDSCINPNVPTMAASADGGILFRESGKKIIIEVKSPSPAVFAQYKIKIHDAESLKAEKEEYYWQTQAELDANPDAEYLDWIVFCPFMKNPIHVVRIDRVEEDIMEMRLRAVRADEMIKEFEL